MRFDISEGGESWQKDEDVTQCNHCKVEFGWFVRKSHCRVCKKIYCRSCIAVVNDLKDLKVDDNYGWKFPWSDGTKLCIPCQKNIQKTKETADSIKLFLLLNIDLLQLQVLSHVCKRWHDAANHLYKRFQKIQHYPPSHKYDQVDKRLLWKNRNLYTGYINYTIHLLKIAKRQKTNEIIHHLSQPRKFKFAFPTRNAHCDKLGIVELLPRGEKHVREFCVARLREMDSKMIKSLIPYLCQFANCLEIGEFLMEITDEELLKLVWYQVNYLKNTSKQDLSLFMTVFKKKCSEEMTKSCAYLSKICQNMPKGELDIKLYLADQIGKLGNHHLVIPFHPNPIKKIHIDKISVKNSKTKPVIIPYDNSHFMIKHENVSQDQIILDIISLIDIILQHDENLHLDIIKYRVISLGKDTGLVEIVENAQTLYHIMEESNFTLQNYILEKNKTKSVEEIRTRFVKSCAIYAVITYLFMIGDRHLNNIMITDEGSLFHIDYGYILGNDPKPLGPEIKLTSQMMDVMGGKNSIYYSQFLELSQRIYNCIRKYTNVFITLLSPMIKDSKILERFLPGEQDSFSKLQLLSAIDRSFSNYNLTDYIHRYGQNNSFINFFSNPITFVTDSL